nr:methylated-DNA--[protein]-cysteine S-methyltransferase [Shewanella maritima]
MVNLNPAQYQAPSLQAQVASPVGEIIVRASERGLTHLTMASVLAEPDVNIETVLIEVEAIASGSAEAMFLTRLHLIKAIKQLQEYFAGQRVSFDLPLAAKGTEFQHQVWQALVDMPYGSFCSYSDIAKQIARPKAVRAVGAANGANPIAIIVPCHRVIGKSGKLTGYAHGLAMKQYLLDLEGV